MPVLENKITAETSFRDRKSKSIQLNPFSVDELGDIVVERIRWVGGDGSKPFTEKGLRRLCESANSIPRKLLENGQGVIEEAAKRDRLAVDDGFVEGVLGFFEELVSDVEIEREEPVSIRNPSFFVDALSPLQRRIVDLLMVNEDLSISELSALVDSDIRSVGSIIRKLRGLDRREVMRKPDVPYPLVVRKGKDKRMGRLQYVYSLSDNVRRSIAEK